MVMRIGDRSFRTTVTMSDDIKFVVCPAFAESISEGDLRWEKKVGDTVAEDEVTNLFLVEVGRQRIELRGPSHKTFLA
jgi:2-oxoglutarate dehydrogenase E2 component (dihydrolipoamide succinyltransferase)